MLTQSEKPRNVIFLAVVGLWLVLWSWLSQSAWAEWLGYQGWTDTTGVVVAARVERSRGTPNSTETTYHVTARYTVAGRTYEVSSGGIDDGPYVGKRIGVAYDPDDPAKARVGSASDPHVGVIIYFLGVIVAMVMGAVGVYQALSHRSRRSKGGRYVSHRATIGSVTPPRPVVAAPAGGRPTASGASPALGTVGTQSYMAGPDAAVVPHRAVAAPARESSGRAGRRAATPTWRPGASQAHGDPSGGVADVPAYTGAGSVAAPAATGPLVAYVPAGPALAPPAGHGPSASYAVGAAGPREPEGIVDDRTSEGAASVVPTLT